MGHPLVQGNFFRSEFRWAHKVPPWWLVPGWRQACLPQAPGTSAWPCGTRNMVPAPPSQEKQQGTEPWLQGISKEAVDQFTKKKISWNQAYSEPVPQNVRVLSCYSPGHAKGRCRGQTPEKPPDTPPWLTGWAEAHSSHQKQAKRGQNRPTRKNIQSRKKLKVTPRDACIGTTLKKS